MTTDRTPATEAGRKYAQKLRSAGTYSAINVEAQIDLILDIERQARREGWDAALAAVQKQLVTGGDFIDALESLARLASEGPR